MFPLRQDDHLRTELEASPRRRGAGPQGALGDAQAARRERLQHAAHRPVEQQHGFVEARGVEWPSRTQARLHRARQRDVQFGPQLAALAYRGVPDIRVIVFRGEGLRGFCAGADIKEQRGAENSLQVRKRMEAGMKERGIDMSGGPGQMKMCLSRESLDSGQWQGEF